MTSTIPAANKRLPIAPYWIAIGLFFLLTTAIYLYHLISGTTPDRAAIHVPILDFDIYWYGIWIVSGIALGCWVVASLAGERAQAVFEASVPDDVRQQPLSALELPEPIYQKLSGRGITTVGEFLYLWGFDPRNLGLKKDEIAAVYEVLLTQPLIDSAWLEDAPWRIWNPEHVWSGVIWALIFGVIGARIYHVLTPSPSMAALGIESPLDYFQRPYQLLNFRSGGLGIYGGLAGGALGLFLYTRRARIPALGWADLAVIGLALGQAVGRWGNFFNQELYGRPSDVPWAVRIEPPYRLLDYAGVERFHPAFLYESIWSFLTFLLLYFMNRRYADRLLPGEITALYLILYAVGRSLLEMVRLDSRTVTLGNVDTGLAVATAVSIVIAILSALLVLLRRMRWNREEGGSPA